MVATDVSENTGNVEENKSMYWHPTVYKYNRTSDTYTRAVMAQSSAYYIWETGETTAFPNGFQMIGGYDLEFSEAYASCDNPEPCDEGDCYTEHHFFPKAKCSELEVHMRMPNCWDGVRLNSPPSHTAHVTYADFGEPGAKCPESHPVRMPQIELFFRIAPYSGGWHLFSDGSNVFHADYVSGWEEDFLQDLLDNCSNEGDGAQPNFFCEEHLNFRDAPKCTDEETCDFGDPILMEKLRAVQPPTPLDIRGSIVAEETEVIVGSGLPRGTCNGPLFGQVGHAFDEIISASFMPPSRGEYICSEDEDCSEDEYFEDDDGDSEEDEDSEEDSEDASSSADGRNRNRLVASALGLVVLVVFTLVY